jgi:acylphosphatase
VSPSFEFAHVIAVGRVQGVGYREFTRRAAEARSVAGFVRNRIDGTVEARIVAPAPALSALLDDLRRGPPHARVTELRIIEQGVCAAETGFHVLATL